MGCCSCGRALRARGAPPAVRAKRPRVFRVCFQCCSMRVFGVTSAHVQIMLMDPAFLIVDQTLDAMDRETQALRCSPTLHHHLQHRIRTA